MSKVERIREALDQRPTPAEWAARIDAGWRPVAIEWERQADATHGKDGLRLEVPYGLCVADDGNHLTEDPDERAVLIAILSQLVEDRSMSEVAAELNSRGHRCRDGSAWTQSAVFSLLPRLIEVAPEIYASREWAELTSSRRTLKVSHRAV